MVQVSLKILKTAQLFNKISSKIARFSFKLEKVSIYLGFDRKHRFHVTIGVNLRQKMHRFHSTMILIIKTMSHIEH